MRINLLACEEAFNSAMSDILRKRAEDARFQLEICRHPEDQARLDSRSRAITLTTSDGETWHLAFRLSEAEKRIFDIALEEFSRTAQAKEA